MRLFNTDYSAKGIRIYINDEIYHIYVRKKGLSIKVVDMFKRINDESVPVKFRQEQIMDFTIINIVKSIGFDLKILFKRFFGKFKSKFG
ncbi:hypothetical protein [Peptoniphilus lacrimalis]|uniref:Uncharacterized protein n=1 Tax=Peptoniphilus lacrimalis TaxID=33031 RepID=A0A379C5X6_9FIRM|nr:hypothetical protein [Peptoniphilus lacrimalis]MDK7722530.1 hypothetical protein [Peptoniphilus lacrimalis]MDK7732081.1 hypothetical protein [Peptoniphilus lacrimalis]SUB57752.1 Uncharacterised protein [Peptoniphilus lacrimalis]